MVLSKVNIHYIKLNYSLLHGFALDLLDLFCSRETFCNLSHCSTCQFPSPESSAAFSFLFDDVTWRTPQRGYVNGTDVA